jgi:uncharacterized membrane protein YcfT
LKIQDRNNKSTLWHKIKRRFDLKPFVDSIKLGSLLTVVSVSLVLLVIFELSRIFMDRHSIFELVFRAKLLIILMSLIANNLFVNKGNGIPMNYIGRCLTDLVLIIFLIMLSFIFGFFRDSTYSIPFMSIAALLEALIYVFISLMLFEVLISVSKRFFIKLQKRFL